MSESWSVSENLEDYRCWTPVQVRFRDMDAMGHLNNAVYLTYFELARQTYFHELGIAGPHVAGQDLRRLFPFILAEVSCRYLEPIELGQEVHVGIRVERIGTRSWIFGYIVTDAQPPAEQPRIFALGRSVQVAYDYEARRTMALPEELLRAMERLEGRHLSRS